MSRDKGNRAAGWVAAYLSAWWPLAEKTPNGRPGADIQNTPGVAFEIKTGKNFRWAWVEQAMKYGGAGEQDDLPVLVWLQEGQGEKSVADATALIPLPMHMLMSVLEEAGYAPARKEEA